MWALIWSVKGIRVYGRQKGVWGGGLLECVGTQAVCMFPLKGPLLHCTISTIFPNPKFDSQSPPNQIHTNGTHYVIGPELGHTEHCWTWEIMHYAWICGDYAAPEYYGSIFSDCLSVLFPSLYIPALIFYLILLCLLDSSFPSSLFPSILPSFLGASGCLPTSDVLLARWCMHISCVFLMLTHGDICTRLWDSALGHISCNDENEDGDEESARGSRSVCVCGWGGASIFCPLSLPGYQSRAAG